MNRLWRILASLIGIGLLVLLIWSLGPEKIWTHISHLQMSAVLILIPYAVLFVFDAIGWGLTLPTKVSLGKLYGARLAGEAVNNVTPTAYLGGEPFKAIMLRHYGIPMTEGLASVVIAKTTLIVAQVIFIFSGAIVLLWLQNITEGIVVIALSAAAAAFCTLAVLWQKWGLFTSFLALIKKLRINLKWLEGKSERFKVVDQIMLEFYTNNLKRFWGSVLMHFIGWILGTVEVYLICYLVGYPVSWIEAYVIESLAQIAKYIGFFTPGAIGVHEWGGVILFSLLGKPESVGLTLILLKRAREIIYTAIGFFLLVRTTKGKKVDIS